MGGSEDLSWDNGASQRYHRSQDGDKMSLEQVL